MPAKGKVSASQSSVLLIIMQMKLNVNDKIVELPTGSSLSALTKKIELDKRSGIAIAVNAEVISKNEWEKYALKDNDSIIIIQASQGG
jgi:sulfur carrier protein